MDRAQKITQPPSIVARLPIRCLHPYSVNRYIVVLQSTKEVEKGISLCLKPRTLELNVVVVNEQSCRRSQACAVLNASGM